MYSLSDNRLSAHLHQSGGIIALGGSAGFAKYLRFKRSNVPWKLREEQDGRPVARMLGTTAGLYVPLTPEQAKGSPHLYLHVHNDQARVLTVRLNGKKDREVTRNVAAGWSTVTVDVPEGVARAGDNEILLFTGKGQPMALEWLKFGGSAPGSDDAPVLYDRTDSSLILPDGGGVSYYVMAPEKGSLTGDISDPACRISVRATAQNGVQVSGTLSGKGSAVELGKLAGQPMLLELTNAGCAAAHLANAALVVPGKAPAVKRGPPPRYVVLWIMDSLRADRVRPFNSEARPETPTFEALARTGTTFVQTYVQGNESRVSHASIWSSLYPVKHRMIKPKAKLDTRWTTVDEVGKSAGMFTSGVSANGYVALKWGMGTRWDKFSNHIHEKLGLMGEDVYKAAIDTVNPDMDSWLLYIGTIDTHVSWRPKEPWIWKYHERGYKGRFARRFSGGDAEKGKRPTDAEIEWVRALYDSNVSYQDDLLRQLVEQLEQWGIADKTMLVVTADHGDEQWEHDRVGHGGSLRETLVHVPLLMHYPPLFPKNSVSEGAEIVDILPTIADALGQKQDPEWQGESLIPLAQGVGAGYPRMTMASQYEGAHAVRMGEWKLRAPGGSTPELYNMRLDPFENTDVSSENPIATRFLADPLWLLRTYNEDWKKAAFGNAANVKAAFPEFFGE